MASTRCPCRLTAFALLMAMAGLPARADDLRPLSDLAQQIDAQNFRIEQLERSLTEQQSLIDELTQQDSEDKPTADDSLDATDPSTITARVERLEETIRPAEELPSDFLEALSTVARRSVNGRLHIDQWGFPESSPGVNTIENGDPQIDPDNRLLYRRIRFGVSGQVPPLNMSYRVDIEFSGQDGSQFRDAWIGWDDLAVFNTLRIGNQKRPYGWDHLNSSNFMVFLERPFVVDAFNEGNRRFGIASYGATDEEIFNWQYGLYNLTAVQNAGSIVNDQFQAELAGRLGHTWWYDESSDGRCYGHLGLSGTVAFPDGDAPNDGRRNNEALLRTRPEGRSSSRWLDTGRISGAEVYEILGIESVFNVGSLQIAGEFMNLWLQRSDASGDDLALHGGYVYASYFLTGEHIPWNRRLGILGRIEPFKDFICVDTNDGCRSRGWGAWQVALRLSYADFNSADVFGGIGESATVALNWYWNSHARLQFNYIFGRVDDRLATLSSGGTSVVSGAYQIAGMRFMIDF